MEISRTRESTPEEKSKAEAICSKITAVKLLPKGVEKYELLSQIVMEFQFLENPLLGHAFEMAPDDLKAAMKKDILDALTNDDEQPTNDQLDELAAAIKKAMEEPLQPAD